MNLDRTPRFVGGMRWRGSNGSWTFAELLVGHDVLVVRLRSPLLRRFLGHWLPSISMPWTEVRAVETVHGGLPLPFSHGLRIIGPTGGKRYVVFWCGSQTNCRQIVDALKQHNIDVTDNGTVW